MIADEAASPAENRKASETDRYLAYGMGFAQPFLEQTVHSGSLPSGLVCTVVGLGSAEVCGQTERTSRAGWRLEVCFRAICSPAKGPVGVWTGRSFPLDTVWVRHDRDEARRTWPVE